MPTSTMTHPVRLHLSWRQNGDSFDVAVAANRLLAHECAVWWCLKPSGSAEAGDYLVEGSPDIAERLSALGLSTTHWPGRLPSAARPLESPRIALLAGKSSAYPYFAYYTLCLTRLGLSYEPVGGGEILGGALGGANLFVLPGGFATWGLDKSEASPGADAAVRAFMQAGGACIGACGGAYYLSAGRPGWTGTAWARPRYTHEYLQSGTGIVSLRMSDPVLALGCPATVEVPYYHGPIWEDVGSGAAVSAVFDKLCLPGRVAIDNPLQGAVFRREMMGRPAILRVQGPRGRAVLFSPHPEMGDLVRKFIALDGYIRHYLPIRGRRTMEETLLAYRPLDSPGFRLALNAVHALMLESPAPRRGDSSQITSAAPPTARPLARLRSFRQAVEATLTPLRVPRATEYGAVVRTVAEDLASRLAPAASGLANALRRLSAMPGAEGQRILRAWNHLATRGTQTLERNLPPRRPVAERLMQVELAITLWDAWRRLIEAECALAPARSRR